MRFLLAVIFAMLMLVAPAEAATLYMAPNGSTTSACTSTAPCGTIQRAYSQAALGDIVEVREGAYGDQTVSASVSKGQPDADLPDITFQPAAGATPTFAAMRFYAPHVTVRGGIEVNGMLSARYRPEQPSVEAAGDIHFDNLRVVDGGRISFAAVKNFSVTNSLIANNYRDGIDIYGSASGASDVGHYPENGLIENNVIRDLRLIDSDHIDGIQFTTGINVVIRDNQIGPNIHHQGLLGKTDRGPLTGITVDGNTFYQVVDPGFSLMFHRYSGRPCSDIGITNNDFYQTPLSRNLASEQCVGELSGNTFRAEMRSDVCSAWLDSYQVFSNTFLVGQPCGSTAPPAADADGDGVPDASDNCISAPNASQADLDSDGIGDACDSQDNRDSDGDGKQNWTDACPTQAGSQADGCPAPPVARFTAPSTVVRGQTVTFDAATSGCEASPCKYYWQDDGPDGPAGTNWLIVSGDSWTSRVSVVSFSRTFSGAGTKYIRLTVTDAKGRVSEVMKTLVVT